MMLEFRAVRFINGSVLTCVSLVLTPIASSTLFEREKNLI